MAQSYAMFLDRQSVWFLTCLWWLDQALSHERLKSHAPPYLHKPGIFLAPDDSTEHQEANEMYCFKVKG